MERNIVLDFVAMSLPSQSFLSAVEQGVVNNTTNKRMKGLENQIEELERQILIEKSKTILKLSKEDIKE